MLCQISRAVPQDCSVQVLETPGLHKFLIIFPISAHDNGRQQSKPDGAFVSNARALDLDKHRMNAGHLFLYLRFRQTAANENDWVTEENRLQEKTHNAPIRFFEFTSSEHKILAGRDSVGPRVAVNVEHGFCAATDLGCLQQWITENIRVPGYGGRLTK